MWVVVAPLQNGNRYILYSWRYAGEKFHDQQLLQSDGFQRWRGSKRVNSTATRRRQSFTVCQGVCHNNYSIQLQLFVIVGRLTGASALCGWVGNGNEQLQYLGLIASFRAEFAPGLGTCWKRQWNWSFQLRFLERKELEDVHSIERCNVEFKLLLKIVLLF